MKLTRHALFLMALTAGSLGAQARPADPDVAARQGNAPVPAGWQVRLDRANANRSDIRFETMGSGMHVTGGPAAIYWNPQTRVSGTYAVQATFTQMKAPQHPEAYGLIWGANDLNQPTQNYLYFVIRKDGKYLVRHRAGDATHDVAPWTEHAAIVKEGADGKQENTLRVEVTPTSSKLFVNGTMIREIPRQGMTATTDGVVGLRVNHNLDVHISGLIVDFPTGR
jgi:hypothetical protein